MRVRTYSVIALIVLVCAARSEGQALLNFHSDITFSYDIDAREWIGFSRHGGSFDEPDQATPFDRGSYPARDLEDPSGDRIAKPSGILDFTGVADGDPIWILSQGDNGYAWVGIRNEQAVPNTLAAFDPDDPRVPRSAQRYLKISLDSMDYSGRSNDPQFSMWQFQGDFIEWMATADGIDTSDLFYIRENAHAHMGWGFSSLGIYRLSFVASAFLESTGREVISEKQSVYFAIGTKAMWLASHYSGEDLLAESVSGDLSDSDGDGTPLLLEYAFNLDPTVFDSHELESGVGASGLPSVTLEPDGSGYTLKIEYVRRKVSTNPQITYQVEFKDALGVGLWESEGAEESVSINDQWERVIVTDSVDTLNSESRFVRVRVETQDSILY